MNIKNSRSLVSRITLFCFDQEQIQSFSIYNYLDFKYYKIIL